MVAPDVSTARCYNSNNAEPAAALSKDIRLPPVVQQRQPGPQPQVWWPSSYSGEETWQRGPLPVLVQAVQPLCCLQNREACLSGDKQPVMVTQFLVTGTCSCCQLRDIFNNVSNLAAAGCWLCLALWRQRYTCALGLHKTW